MKECYYDILGVSRTANETDLKKAYRLKALECHPDKNPDDPEKAQQKFILVQQAYEVLTDPHERAWYDSHREQILRDTPLGMTPMDQGLTVDQCMPYFSASIHSGYHDQVGGFYQVYRDLFDQFLQDELQFQKEGVGNVTATHSVPLSVSFGDSKSEASLVLQFYDYFKSMVTFKSFSWLDPYKPMDAPDRRIRRLMEKENKKRRETAKREYIETIHKLAEYVYKRDPRIKAFKQNAEQQRQLHQKQQLERQRRMKKEEIQLPYVEQAWSKIDYDDVSDDLDEEEEEEEKEEEEVSTLSSEDPTSIPNELSDSESETDEIELALKLETMDLDHSDLYCVACNEMHTDFETMQTHLNSNSHVQKVQLLREQLLEEEKKAHTLSTPHKLETSDSLPTTNGKEMDVYVCEVCDHKVFSSALQYEAHCKNKKHLKALRQASKHTPKASTRTSSVLSSSKKPFTKLTSPTQTSSDIVDNPLSSDILETRKEAEIDSSFNSYSKKGASTDSNELKTEWQCNVCSNYFHSRNKLFQHIKDEGHAIASKFHGDLNEWDELNSLNHKRDKKRSKKR